MDKNTQVRAGWMNSGDRKHEIKQKKQLKKKVSLSWGLLLLVSKRKSNILTKNMMIFLFLPQQYIIISCIYYLSFNLHLLN